jgi:hypothetical protein
MKAARTILNRVEVNEALLTYTVQNPEDTDRRLSIIEDNLNELERSLRRLQSAKRKP